MKHWWLAALLVVPQLALAAEDDPSADDESATPLNDAGKPAVEAVESRLPLSLDSLLSPRPGEWEAQQALRAGRDRAAWRREFDGARSEVQEFEKQVDALQEKLRKASSGGEWSYSPSGAGEASDPEVLKLRARLRRDRGSLDSARGRLRDLEVEASLAEVPDHWIDPSP